MHDIAIIALSHRSLKTRGKYFAIIDAEDFERLSKYPWTARIAIVNGRTGKTAIYAIRREYINDIKKIIYLHHEVLKTKTEDIFPKGILQADHINRNTLDNRKINLRMITPSQNGLNTERAIKAKGYFFHKTNKRYMCRWRSKYIGNFKTEQEAINAIEEAKNACSN